RFGGGKDADPGLHPGINLEGYAAHRAPLTDVGHHAVGWEVTYLERAISAVLRAQRRFVAVAVNPIRGRRRDRLRLAAINAEQRHQFAKLANRHGPLTELARRGLGNEAIEIEAIIRIAEPRPPLSTR